MQKLIIILTLIVMNISVQAQSWIDRELYPFESHYLRLEDGNMHFIDEGNGDVVLFVHGTPTWSFLYRDFVKELSKSKRCIAIDHIGFGLSDKPMSFEGTPEKHAENLIAFIQKLDLKDITLVVHDFGGPIGLGAALEMPDRIKNIVVLNSWLWSTRDNPMAQEIDKLLNSPEGEAAYIEMNYSPTVLLKQAFANPENLAEDVHNHFIQPFSEKEARHSLLKIGRAFVGSSDWYEEKWQELNALSDKNWLILWGEKDPFLNQGFLAKWENKLPNAEIKKLDSGHFVQEESTGKAIEEIHVFLK